MLTDVLGTTTRDVIYFFWAKALIDIKKTKKNEISGVYCIVIVAL
jgi:hypothetical protein